MKKWNGLFEPHILNRGKIYQHEGRVDNLMHKHGSYSATVSGTEEYEVEIFCSGDVIEEMVCTCPYAQSGNNCKHMAAVLYAIEEDGVLPIQTERESRRSPAELVQSMSEAQIREYLTELARNDSAVYQELTLRYGKLSAKEQKRILLSEIDSITENYTYYGEISYNNAWDYAVDISDFIEQRPMTMFKWGKPQLVLEVAFQALEEYCSQEVDDSDGGTWQIENAVKSCCKDLLAQCSLQQEHSVFSWLQAYRSREEIHWIIRNIIDEMMDSFFEEPSFAERKLELVQAAIEDELASDSSKKLKSLLTKEYFFLRKIPEKAQEYEEFCDQYKCCDFFRKAKIEVLLQESDWDQLTPLLLESRSIDADQRETVRKYTEILIRIYTETGNEEKLKSELIYHIRNFYQKDLNNLLHLKSLVSEENWVTYRTEYLSRKYEPQRLELMQHEKLWEELMSAMGQENSIYTLQLYGKSLQKRFPERFCELYVRKLREKAKECSTRNAYQGLMRDLEHLSCYSNGRAFALKIAAEWRSLYYRRSAMMDELQKAGF